MKSYRIYNPTPLALGFLDGLSRRRSVLLTRTNSRFPHQAPPPIPSPIPKLQISHPVAFNLIWFVTLFVAGQRREREADHGADAGQVRSLRRHQQGAHRHQARGAASPVRPQGGKDLSSQTSDLSLLSLCDLKCGFDPT